MSFSSHTRPTNYHCHFLVLVLENMLSKCGAADPDHHTLEAKTGSGPSRKTGS